MSYRYLFDPKAATEFEAAYAWYWQQSEAAAESFLVEVEQKLLLICTYPTRYRNVYKDLRELSLKRFPYSIIYLTDEKEKRIVITSVFHHKRNPAKKYKK